MFDVKAFNKVNLVPRTEKVEVPALAQWFGDDEPEWEVRSLTFDELSKSDSASEKSKTLLKVVESLAGGSDEDKARSLKDALGFGEDTPENTIKRIEHLTYGSVNPTVTTQTAVKLAESFPAEFMLITNKIVELTGLGRVPGKPKSSGRKRVSKAQ